jgi:hypothetical protein
LVRLARQHFIRDAIQAVEKRAHGRPVSATHQGIELREPLPLQYFHPVAPVPQPAGTQHELGYFFLGAIEVFPDRLRMTRHIGIPSVKEALTI